MIKRRIERVAVTLLSAAVLLSSTGIASSLAANEIGTSGSTTAVSASAANSSTTVSQEGGAISSTTIATEGGELVAYNKGSGTVSDPYRISDVTDFVAMQEKVNLTTSANKNFVLTSDIDLSSLNASDFTSNSVYSGSLVSASKNLSASSKNVYFTLDGNGHSIKGLNIAFGKGENFAIFGYVNSRSTIKNLTVENCVINVSTDVKNCAVLVAENDGTISNCEISRSVLTLKNVANAGMVAAVNTGTVTGVKVTGTQPNVSGASAASHTISANGAVGAIVGQNIGKITGVSAINVGEYINVALSEKTVYGGIAGSNSGIISNSFASGNVVGGKATDFVGGLAGSASKGAKFVNNYVLVALKCSASGNGLVGVGGTSEMLTDCYWSSDVSGRMTSATNYGTDINDIDTLRFKTVKVGETATLSKSALSASWGKASFAIGDSFKQGGTGIAVSGLTVKGVTANKVAWFNYKTEISLPSTIGTGSLKIMQSFDLPILVVPANTVGDGTASDPLVVENTAEFHLLKYAQGIHAELSKDISVSGSAFSFKGNLDGNGHTVSVSAPVFTEVCGTVSNINFVSKTDLSSAVLGNALNAKAKNVSVTIANGAAFNASGVNSGVMFGTVAGNSELDNCRVKAEVNFAGDVASFGALVGSVIGNGTRISNSGAAANIAASKRATNAAIVIGSVNATDVKIENCYVSGKNDAGKYSFIANISADDTRISNIYMSKGTQTPADFAKADKSQFVEWSFDDGEVAFFTGNGGKFNVTLPSVKAMSGSTASDYSVKTDTSLISAKVTVENGKLILNVGRAAGVITVKGCAVTVTNKTTGLYTTVKISNGLEKDSAGNYIVSGAYDLAYISENITELNKSSFIVESDIDMSEISTFTPIGGTLVPFSGKFNGNGHTISNLKISGTSKSGLFAALENAEVSNLVIASAQVNAKGLYSAVLAGQVFGNTKLSEITVVNSNVVSDGIYSGVIAGSVSGTSGMSGIRVENCSVNSKANYVGALAGYASVDGALENSEIKNVKLNGAEYVGGAVGLAEGKTAIKSASVEGSIIKGVSEISGIAAGRENVSVADARVSSSEISTIADTAAFVAGGIASSFCSSISSVEVRDTTIKAGVASAIVGKAAMDAKLSIKGANVCNTTVRAESANSVAAGILAVYNAGGAVVISEGYVDSATTIISTSVASGVVGDITGAESALVAENIKSFANVETVSSADAVAAAGAVAKLSGAALNNVQFKNVKILGTVSGEKSIGGMIGIVKGIGNFNGMTAVISDSVCAARIKTEKTNKNAGIVVGFVEDSKSVNSDNIDSLVSGTVISTYFGNVPAFGESTEIKSTNIVDMDNPNGSAIKPSVENISIVGKTEIALSNLPKVKGYSFDSTTGWVSEAEERISVVSSSEDKLVLKVNHMADISIVAYYVSNSDSEIRIPVHFAIKSDVRTPLKGDGTSTSPYLISNAYDLESVAYYDSLGKYFALAEDISFDAKDFDFGGGFYNVGNGVVTIGSAESGFKGNFTGLYNGKIHSINGLMLSGNVLGGLFGATDGAAISDIVINNASVTGLNFAGVVVGIAKNTVIKNVTVNNSTAMSSEFGSTAGIIAGKAEGLTAENISINQSNASTTLNATSATVETAGGVAGIFSGELKDIQMNSVTVKAGTISGGAVGSSAKAQLENVVLDGKASAKIAGGMIGVLENPNNSFVKNCFISGGVSGEKLAAGVIAEVGSNSTYIAKTEQALVESTVIAAKAEGEISAAVIAKADKGTFSDNDNAKILSNVYYSSYQNESIFGTQELNSYQCSGYMAFDLSAMRCVLGGTEKSFITLDGENTVLGESDIIIAAGNGNYKLFELLGHKFELASVSSKPKGVLTYDSSTSSVSAKGAVDGAKLVFTYSNGLETAIPVAYSSLLAGSGTKSDPYRIGTADEFAVMMQNGDREDVYYTLTNDIDLSGVKSADSFEGILDGANHVAYDFSGESLFASVSGTVKNIGFVGFDIDSKSSTTVGALAGELNGATIENCVVIADVNTFGKVQDAGIIAGRATNGTKIEKCITSGRVSGSSLLAAGGLVGSSSNSQINGTVSTAYVSAGGYAGGLVGEADYTALSNSVFGNMTNSLDKKAGNIAGRFAETSSAENVLFDSCTVKNDIAAVEGATGMMKASTTKALEEASIIGFASTKSGYAVPATLKSTEASEKFATAVEFAALAVKYMSGSNIGSAMNYTDIKVPSEVNSNSVSVDRSKGLVITLMKNKDYASTDNIIARYSNPASGSLTDIGYSIVDKTNKLNGKLIGVMLKTKADNNAEAFSFFTKVGAQAKAVNSVYVADGIYIDLSLPQGYGYEIKAVDSDGKELNVTDVANEGKLIEVNESDSVDITVEIKEVKTDWGLRSVWSVIGK